MTVPIKRGTARRLGLKQPRPTPCTSNGIRWSDPSYVLKFDLSIPEDEREWIKAQMIDAELKHGISPVSFEFSREPIKRRPWWLFWRRG